MTDITLFKAGEVWITTDGTPVYIRSSFITSKKRGRVIFCSVISHGVVNGVQQRWHASDVVHLCYSVPIKIEPDVTPPVYLGRVHEPWALSRSAA